MTMALEFRKKDPRVTIARDSVTSRFGSTPMPRLAMWRISSISSRWKFYDGTTFHRVVPGFLIQGGDPLSKTSDRVLHGTGGPGYFLSPEPNDQPHKRGAISMAKMPRESNSTRDFNDNGSQFFICVGENSGLDRRYTVFGEVFRGIEIVDKIVGVPRDEWDNPLDPITITITVKE